MYQIMSLALQNYIYMNFKGALHQATLKTSTTIWTPKIIYNELIYASIGQMNYLGYLCTLQPKENRW
jgi:hypothetical protein